MTVPRRTRGTSVTPPSKTLPLRHQRVEKIVKVLTFGNVDVEEVSHGEIELSKC